MSKRSKTPIVEVVYERDPVDRRTWLVHIVDEPRAHTYGRTLSAARRNMAEVVELWKGLKPGTYDVRERIRVKANVDEVVDRARAMRAELVRLEAEAAEANRQAAAMLVGEGELSYRDAAEALGVSFQRVHQLVESER